MNDTKHYEGVLPCPFCGRPAFTQEYIFEPDCGKPIISYGPGCDDEDCYGCWDPDSAYYETEEAARNAWNKRAELAEARAMPECVKKLCGAFETLRSYFESPHAPDGVCGELKRLIAAVEAHYEVKE
jgi:hypothetical protein